LKVGDSLVATQMMDTFIKRNPWAFHLNFKRVTGSSRSLKSLTYFQTTLSPVLTGKKTEKEWFAKEAVLLDKWIADKKIPARKTPSGAYVQIINPGTGNLIDSVQLCLL
jgi:hypothetical protein